MRNGNGGNRGFEFKFEKDIDIDTNIDVKIHKEVVSKAMVFGQLADAEAYATVNNQYGDGLAETLTATHATPTTVEAYSGSISATNGAWFYLG